MTHEPKSPTYRKLKLKIPQSKVKHFGSFKPTEEVLQAWDKTSVVININIPKQISEKCWCFLRQKKILSLCSTMSLCMKMLQNSGI
jgi:hypothetical protein